MPIQQSLVPVQQSAQPPPQQQADMGLRQAAGQQRPMDWVLQWLLLGSPLILALVVTQAKWGGAVSFADRVGEWVEARHDKVKLKDGFFSRWVQRPTLWCIRQVFMSSAQIQNHFLRAGVRLASALYIVGVILVLAYVVTVVVLGIVFLGVMLWVLSLFLGDSDTSPSRGVASRVAKGIMRSGESRRREGVFGSYDESRDDDGTVLSESRQREGVFGSYVETRDADGNVIGESRQREGVFGSYTETRDKDGNVIAESRQREGVFGPYVETRDATGKVVSESRDREGLFGPYTEHKKVGN